MINNKGIMWASNYWTKVVTQEGLNGVNKGDIYGKKGDNNWEYIALAEGWANYREWKMCKTYLKYNPITKVKYDPNPINDDYYATPKHFLTKIYYRYSGLFVDFNGIFSDKEIENAISNNNSIKSFNEYIINNLRNSLKRDYIKRKLEYYETVNFE